jgi:predicted TIM-barrel fold metal-dependent hydrolase
MTPLFDANAHPALAPDGSTENFSTLKALLDEAGFRGACAVGLPAKNGFALQPYLDGASAHGFFPVAAWNITPDARKQIADLARLGYRAIKTHPRLSGLSVRDPGFVDVLRAAAETGMTVFHCCYQFSADARHPVDPLPALMDAVAGAPGLRMVLLHGGTVELLRYAEAIRANRNLLLDLSFTLNRYDGSSLDQDIGFLFRTFDQRICIGSDYPDYAPAQVRARFEYFAAGLAQDKRDNIGWRNITTLLEIVS